MSQTFEGRLTAVLITIIVVAALQMVVHALLDRVVRRTVRGHRYASKEDEQKREDTLVKIFRTLVTVVLWTVTTIIILFELHVNVAGLLTGAGLIGVVVSLGAQNAIKDFLAGIFIIMENQYRVGDIINLSANVPGGVGGVVEDITVRITKLRDMDGNLHIVPNGSAGVVTNMTFKFANVNIDIPVGYDTDVDKLRTIINQVGVELAGDEKLGLLQTEAIQFLRVDSFGPSMVTLKALGKVRPGAQWEVAGEFRLRLKEALDKHKIKLPSFPQAIVYTK